MGGPRTLVQGTRAPCWPSTRRSHLVPLATASSLASDSLVTIRAANGLADFTQVAALRAEAFYEDDRSRFVSTFKRQFIAQEIESLQQRTQPSQLSAGCQTTDCLVALASDSQQVVLGCIDIRLPRAATGVHPAGVPAEDHQGAYLLNVVVHMDWRGQGVGKALMRGAMERARSHWQASDLYTHVAADNEVAWGLYRSCGFEEHSCEAKYSQASALGKEQQGGRDAAGCGRALGMGSLSKEGGGP
ncbi:N-acetyltransferase domain-containing protein [Haematococcus lacustris]|uniref:N-acetyltransferase domain-containing protein n=1 Tax=Haematococcus lacustris TaxID=44745 RepID=A0A6A0ABM3_HAELA|nr:N-acetyltransferase domain-containing protein [Haematococcus lacustris]